MGKLRILGRMGDQSVTWEKGDKKTFEAAKTVFDTLVNREYTHRGVILDEGLFVEDLSEENFIQDQEIILIPKMAGG